MENRILVVAGVIFRDCHILLQQRMPSREFPYTWECPGGKVEQDDPHPRDALWRELTEELGWERGGAGSGGIHLDPCFETDFDPPAVKTACTVRFYKGYAFPTWHPELRDALGVGWFTFEQMLRMYEQLTPGNQRLVIAEHEARRLGGSIFR
jgi:8-oxo-dGTP pyrophosphatase MutT (NUDIX family)